MASVRKRKDGSYELRWIENRKRKSRYFALKREADAEKVRLSKLSSGNESGNLTVKELVASYLERQKKRVELNKLSPNTYLTREINLRKYIVDEIGELYIAALDRKYWRTFFERPQAKSRAFQIAYETLRAVLNEAVLDGLIDSNPIAGISGSRSSMRPTHDKKPRHILEKHEVEMILKVSDSPEYPPYLRPLLLVALHTGARQGELFALQWDDIDLSKRRIKISRSATMDLDGQVVDKAPKTKSSKRDIVISHSLADSLEEWHREQPDSRLVFPNANGLMLRSANFMERVFRPLVRSCGYDIDFHALRHTNASHMIAGGINIKVIQHRLGHTSIKTTLDTYGHLLVDSQDEAAEVMET